MTIVYSYDFSEASTECAPAAVAVAARLGEPLLLTHVINPRIPSLPPELEAKLDSTTHARLDSFASQLRALQPETQVSAVELRGDPVDELIGFAREHAHLLILASPGHRDASRRVVSVSERVAQGATVPVLVMREPGPWLDWAAGRRSLRAVLGVSRDASCTGAIELATRVRAAAPCDVIATEVYFAPGDRRSLRADAPGAPAGRESRAGAAPHSQSREAHVGSRRRRGHPPPSQPRSGSDRGSAHGRCRA